MERRRLALTCAACTLVGAGVASAASESRVVIHGVADRSLTAALERAGGEPRTAPANRLDARRRAREAAVGVEALLRSEGYYDAAITPSVLEGARPRGVLDVALGPRTAIAAVAVDWTGDPPDARTETAVQAALKLAPGRPARAPDVVAAEGRVLAALTEHGYADAATRPRRVVVDHATHDLRATFTFAAGRKVRLGGLRLASKGRTRPAWVGSLKSWRVGDVYKPNSVAELERRLTDTRVYDAVTVALAPHDDPDGLRPVQVSLVDRPPRSLDFSAGYSTSEGGDFDVRWSHFNTFARADTITLETRLAQLDSRYGGEIQLPDFWGAGQTLTPGAYYFRTVTDAYTETGEIASVDLTQRYGKTSFLTRGISITSSRVNDKELGALNLTSLRLIGSFFVDRSDNTLDPTRGWKADARFVPTFTTGDENLVYLRAVAQASGYLAFDPGGATVMAVRGRIGSLVGGAIPAVPAEDRFFAGGGGSVRGYAYQGVGPHYPDNTPEGGLSLLEASVELRQRIGATPFSAVAFVDSGSVGLNAYPQLRTFSTAVGVGARYSLGFAPIRADIAVPLDRGVNGQQPFQVYLSIGQSF